MSPSFNRVIKMARFLLLYVYYDNLNWMSGNKSDKLSLEVKRFIKREAREQNVKSLKKKMIKSVSFLFLELEVKTERDSKCHF